MPSNIQNKFEIYNMKMNDSNNDSNFISSLAEQSMQKPPTIIEYNTRADVFSQIKPTTPFNTDIKGNKYFSENL